MKLKKILFIGLMFFFGARTFSNKVFASSLPSWEFFPAGINYFDDKNFIFYNRWPNGHYTNEYDIRVKPNTTYTISAYQYQELDFKDIYIYFFDENKSFAGMTNEKLDRDIHFTFTTNDKTHYIKVNLEVNLMSMDDGYVKIDDYIALYEGEKLLPPFDIDKMKYQGPQIDYSIILPTQSGYIIKSFDEEVNLEDILRSLYAYDDHDGNISHLIKVITDNYSDNASILGEWEIMFEVQDSSNNISRLQVIINNMDYLAPTISGVDFYQTTQNKLILIDEIIENLSAVDNYDGDVLSQVKVNQDNYTENYNKIGLYEIIFEVSDSSNNLSYFTVQVDVSDSTPPTITGPELLLKNKTDVMTVEYIKSLLEAEDNIDGDISSQIVIEYDDYTSNSHRYGEWEVQFSVSDNAGNKTYFTVCIEVIDEIPPIFLVDQTTINLDLKESNLTVDQVVNLLKRARKISDDATVEVLSDDYTPNKTTAGSYKIVLGFDDEELEVTINVIEDLFDQMKQTEKLSLWASLVKIILLVLKYIWQFFKGIFI